MSCEGCYYRAAAATGSNCALPALNPTPTVGQETILSTCFLNFSNLFFQLFPTLKKFNPNQQCNAMQKICSPPALNPTPTRQKKHWSKDHPVNTKNVTPYLYKTFHYSCDSKQLSGHLHFSTKKLFSPKQSLPFPIQLSNSSGHILKEKGKDISIIVRFQYKIICSISNAFQLIQHVCNE